MKFVFWSCTYVLCKNICCALSVDLVSTKNFSRKPTKIQFPPGKTVANNKTASKEVHIKQTPLYLYRTYLFPPHDEKVKHWRSGFKTDNIKQIYSEGVDSMVWMNGSIGRLADRMWRDVVMPYGDRSDRIFHRFFFRIRWPPATLK